MTDFVRLPTSCERIVSLCDSVAAAYTQDIVYFFSLKDKKALQVGAAFAKVHLPSGSGPCAPWHPPGAPLLDCGVFYELSGSVYLRRCTSEAAQVQGRDLNDVLDEHVLDTTPLHPEGVREMAVLFGTTLAICTGSEALFYWLDPSNNVSVSQLPLIGSIALPLSNGNRPEAVDAVSIFMSGSCTEPTVGEDEHHICIVATNAKTKRFGLLSLAASATRVTNSSLDSGDGFTLPKDTGEVLCCSFNWRAREVLLVLQSKKAGRDRTSLSANMDTLKCTLSSLKVPHNTAGITHTSTGEAWALLNTNEDPFLLRCLSREAPVRELSLMATLQQHNSIRGKAKMMSVGSTLCVLLETSLAMVHTEGDTEESAHESTGRSGATRGASLFSDWLQQQVDNEECGAKEWERDVESEKELSELLQFLKHNSSEPPAAVIRDCRYVRYFSGVYHHSVLDEVGVGKSGGCGHQQVLRYICVAQSVHPATILRVLSVDDAAARLAAAVILASKPALSAGGLRLLDWGGPVRAYCLSFGCDAGSDSVEPKRFAAGLLDTALVALSSGALGAVEVLCTVADAVLVEAFTTDCHTNRSKSPAASRTVEQVELFIAEAISVLLSYAGWAMGTVAPSLGIITAYLAPPREEDSCRKEAMVRDRMAHAIATSKNVHIEPLLLGRM
ncbi:hypothetical protein ERJ75_000137700 [Trypanosoma vivax]|uniref:Uncharacterized protein n=1 Tax=Trypanosoma vivax (strain Y486) TaxID=1055687 RepID=G0TW84_TRYVY|nr:hypothetical protein TRVL_02735 [Trypanosoma vivax]KAH8619612.1 hypothetical protein ERJ75_000137700 [Trypanosoma vivax]CCC48222.1 conserved hypothetical protein [Trypanosoma vivax Y486]